MPDTDAALMTAFLHRANPIHARNIVDRAMGHSRIHKYDRLSLPSAEVVIRSSASHPVSVDEPGELCVRGPQVMRGYWNRPQLPEANIGKVMRRCLRAQLAETSPSTRRPSIVLSLFFPAQAPPHAIRIDGRAKEQERKAREQRDRQHD